MAQTQKKERNRLIVILHRKGTSFARLGEMFKIHKSMAAKIWYKYHELYKE